MLKNIITYLFLVFINCTIFANATNNGIIETIKTHLLSFDNNIALKKIDSVLVSDYKILTKSQKHTLKTLQVQALTNANLFEDALKVSNSLLTDNSLSIHNKISVLLSNALTYEYIGNFDKCKAVLNEIEGFYSSNKLDKDFFFGKFLYRKASFYRVQQKYNEARKFAQQAKAFGLQHNYNDVIANASMILGFIDFNTKEALEHFNFGLKFWKAVQDEHGINGMYLALANYKLRNKQYKTALKYCDSVIEVEKNSNRFSGLANAYQIKSTIFEKLKKLDSAVYNLKKYQELSHYAEINQQELKVLQLNNNFALETAKIEQDQVVKDLNNEKKFSNILTAVVFGLILFSGLLLFLFIKNKLSTQKIKQQQKQLNKNVEEKNVLLKELHHRVKNNLSMILSLIMLQQNEVDSEAEKKLLQDLEKRIQTIAITHNQFLYNSKDNKYSLQDYIDKIIHQFVNIHGKPIKINKEITNKKVSLDTALPIGIIINELITNSIKHAKINNELVLNIGISKSDKKVLINYHDNGKPEKNTTKKENLGLFLIDSMVKQLYGTYKNKDFKYQFSLNIKK